MCSVQTRPEDIIYNLETFHVRVSKPLVMIVLSVKLRGRVLQMKGLRWVVCVIM